MKLVFPIISFLTITFFFSSAQPVKPAGDTYAVVIGIKDYENENIPDLSFSDRDARLFSDWLKSNAGGRIPERNIHLLLNKDATVVSIYQSLQWLKDSVKTDDLVYFYFSGHGDVEIDSAKISEGFLLAYNSPPNNYMGNAIRIEDVNNMANTLTIENKAKVILITDACRSGKLAGDFFKGKQLTAKNLRAVLNDQVRLASCDSSQLAAEGPQWDHGRGVFSYYLLNGLEGKAPIQKDSTIQLEGLSRFLDSCMANDLVLKQRDHPQNPVADGNPYFPLAKLDSLSFIQLKEGRKPANPDGLFGALATFKKIGFVPMEYFFSIAQTLVIEEALDFDLYKETPVSEFPLKMLDDFIAYTKELILKLDPKIDVENPENFGLFGYWNEIPRLDSLMELRKDLVQKENLVRRFNERFVAMVHSKGQGMINAYLKGDLAELENRQYYNNHKKKYTGFSAMQQVAVRLAGNKSQVSSLIQTQQFYISGLISRLQIATTPQADSLLSDAFQNIFRAKQLEPYAAYIFNELGNLYMLQKNFDSAAVCFQNASELAPTWAIPWSNLTRLNIALKRLDEAKIAIHKADSLQPNLAFVLMNAGLVMEKEKNLLAAESYYKRAVEQNKVHFFPYSRLGNIYLQSGNFSEADYYLKEAKKRTAGFSINDNSFYFGIELGGPPHVTPGESLKDFPCESIPFDSSELPYFSLLDGLQKLYQSERITKDELEPTLRILKQLSAENPFFPLADHYIGKTYFSLGIWEEAIPYLLKAIKVFKPYWKLKWQLEKEAKLDSCMVLSLLNYAYEQPDDHYLLANMYEKTGKLKEAIDQYLEIAEIENQQQIKQATFEGFDYSTFRLNESLFRDEENGKLLEENQVISKYESPVPMIGTLKAARLYEKAGQFLEAEALLLNQVQKNRDAGDLRQETLKTKMGPAQLISGIRNINYYWLNINRNLEGETFGFYKRMEALFPRDFEWKQKAGLFLYQRLNLSFKQLPLEESKEFYESVKKNAYPFDGSDTPAEEDSLKVQIPFSNEEILIRFPWIDPVKEAFNWLNESVKLSGNREIPDPVLQALGDIQHWMGNNEKSLVYFQQLVKIHPNNSLLRSQLVHHLQFNHYLAEAVLQLDTLKMQGSIHHDQLFQLIEQKIIAQKFKEAEDLKRIYKPANAKEQYEWIQLNIKLNWLKGNPKGALPYLKDSLPKLLSGGDEYFTSYEYMESEISLQYYELARTYALLKKEKEAISNLSKAMENGFQLKYVLNHDPAWNKLKGKRLWNQLNETYPLGIGEMVDDEDFGHQFKSALDGRIPGYFRD